MIFFFNHFVRGFFVFYFFNMVVSYAIGMIPYVTCGGIFVSLYFFRKSGRANRKLFKFLFLIGYSDLIFLCRDGKFPFRVGFMSND